MNDKAKMDDQDLGEMLAGLSTDKFTYNIIPSYQDFHFAKPNPAFFAELLGRIGWPRQATVMVGDDPQNDIQGAQLLGIPTFWVSNQAAYPDGMPPPKAVASCQLPVASK